MKLAFLGLGVMGFPMAGHLAANGHDVTVYNRTATVADKWCHTHKGESAQTPAEAAAGADIVFACVGNDDDLRQVCAGPKGAAAAMSSGTIFVDHTTTSAAVAREMANALAAKDIDFLDAPISGGQAGAENGQLTVMVGGSEDAYKTAEPVIASFAKMCRLMGPVGCGQLTKMVNQICIAGVVQGLAEGIHFAQQAELDVAAVIDVISKGAAQSWQMENRWKTMNENEYEFGFAVDWMRKDLGFCLDEARKNGSKLPLTALVDQFYGEVQGLGGGRWDTSSLLARLRNSNP